MYFRCTFFPNVVMVRPSYSFLWEPHQFSRKSWSREARAGWSEGTTSCRATALVACIRAGSTLPQQGVSGNDAGETKFVRLCKQTRRVIRGCVIFSRGEASPTRSSVLEVNCWSAPLIPQPDSVKRCTRASSARLC